MTDETIYTGYNPYPRLNDRIQMIYNQVRLIRRCDDRIAKSHASDADILDVCGSLEAACRETISDIRQFQTTPYPDLDILVQKIDEAAKVLLSIGNELNGTSGADSETRRSDMSDIIGCAAEIVTLAVEIVELCSAEKMRLSL